MPVKQDRASGGGGRRGPSGLRRRSITISMLVVLIVLLIDAHAHPLGQFSINHFARIEIGSERVRVRYVIDLAEVPTFQASRLADVDSSGSLSVGELNDYLEKIAPGYVENLVLMAGGKRVTLDRTGTKEIGLLPGTSGSEAMGLAILRIVLNLEGRVDISSQPIHFTFEDKNESDRPGWRELVLSQGDGIAVFNSTIFGNSLTDELKAYPENPTLAPLGERNGEWDATAGKIPAGARSLSLRDGRPVIRAKDRAAKDRFAELIAVPKLTPGIVLIGLIFAMVLGGVHALSPGHGKTIVGAYLIGSRGTPRHAALLGLTVTITHTVGVYALGIITLFASKYVLPEKLYPILSLISGLLVLAIGLTMFAKRIRNIKGHHSHDHEHDHAHHHHHHHHGIGLSHSHAPVHDESGSITVKSLIALGVSGGIIPCPSALIVMLAAISLNRIVYGLVLIVAFSFGLAIVLTAVGIAFVYGGKLIDRIPAGNIWLRLIPALSSLVIAFAGGLIVLQALNQSGVELSTWFIRFLR
ncbi:MAG: sulfite exporter TauE/SafE family protein [Acidobacteria bacterium]|nr:sulfite exporter TauE/SafE family protein [Acidobacteriota bacterium]